jgi:hypothetical protein
LAVFFGSSPRRRPIFPSPRGNKPVATLQKLLDRIRKPAEVGFHLHDLRRRRRGGAIHQGGQGRGRVDTAVVHDLPGQCRTSRSQPNLLKRTVEDRRGNRPERVPAIAPDFRGACARQARAGDKDDPGPQRCIPSSHILRRRVQEFLVTSAPPAGGAGAGQRRAPAELGVKRFLGMTEKTNAAPRCPRGTR